MPGTSTPYRLSLRHQIAVTYAQVGNRCRALDLARELLADRERVLGADHSDTKATRANIAAWANRCAGRAT